MQVRLDMPDRERLDSGWSPIVDMVYPNSSRADKSSELRIPFSGPLDSIMGPEDLGPLNRVNRISHVLLSPFSTFESDSGM